MIRIRSIGTAVAAFLFVFATLTSFDSGAQSPGFVFKPILQSSVSGQDNMETFVVAITIAPGGSNARHTHHGDCYGSVIEGTVEIRADGREPRQVLAGEAFHSPRGEIHQFRNVSDKPVRIVNTQVVEKGKPRTQPAPQ
jgi:quercetin dioxygenase-like cupin family protein